MRRTNGLGVIVFQESSELSNQFWRGCFDKQRFTSKRRANGEIRVMTMRGYGQRAGKILNAYKCRACGHWHIGNARIGAA